MKRQLNISVALFVFLAIAGIRSACPQTTPMQPAAPAPAEPQPGPGPLLVERIENTWMVSPDARAADLGSRVGALVGAYGGHLTDRTWLFGGGGYWLTNRDDDFKLAYGGFVFQWLALKDRPVGFGVRTLVGGGSATLPVTASQVVRDGGGHRDIRFGSRRTLDGSTRFAANDDFFITEPQVDFLWNITHRHRLSLGVGYRFIGAGGIIGDDLEGVSGSVAFQIGGK